MRAIWSKLKGIYGYLQGIVSEIMEDLRLSKVFQIVQVSLTDLC